MKRTPEEIKKGLAIPVPVHYHVGDFEPHLTHLNFHALECLHADALALIEQLEAERDAAVSELVGTCQVCRWEETAKCASCHFCTDAWNVHDSNWEWRGAQKEE